MAAFAAAGAVDDEHAPFADAPAAAHVPSSNGMPRASDPSPELEEDRLEAEAHETLMHDQKLMFLRRRFKLNVGKALVLVEEEKRKSRKNLYVMYSSYKSEEAA